MPARVSRFCILFAALATAASMLCMPALAAQNLITIDATAPAPAPQPVAAALGSSRNPHGEVLGVNSEYLTLNGKPWLPVMGEFHFSRYPAAEWEEEILKMKAAGVQIVSTYIIWIHHEQTEGSFDWSGQRNLRRFVELCAKHGMYVYPRIGPWAHAETRNGGLPDWVLKNSPTRENNPIYLNEVQAFYSQIAAQLNGLLWKDGGPVIGIQIENEYHETGPGKGAAHIRTLKQLAVKAGLDVPLYTVTGWDGAAIPLDQVLPVFGGYAAAPWSGSNKKLPAAEVYAFRFTNRAAGSMGAIGGNGQNAASTYFGTPFLTAEVGDGIEDTYFRRPVLNADDVAAIVPVMLGSGANLLGYYMFQGGRNPDARGITLQESQRTGYPTDVPVRSYDFQAPLGEFGQERESLRKLKLANYFLNDFGAQLAPMATHAPSRIPSSPADFSAPRVAARTLGNRGFIFFNNYVRGFAMQPRRGFQVKLKLPSGVVRVPAAPIDLPSGAYGIWPVNLPLPGATLRYSTAQLFKRVQNNVETYLFFFAIPGVPAEFAFDAQAKIAGVRGTLHRMQTATGALFRAAAMDGRSSRIDLANHTHLVLVSESQAEEIWRGDNPSLLLATDSAAFSDGNRWTLESDGNPQIRFSVFGDASPLVSGAIPMKEEAQRGLFRSFHISLPSVDLEPRVRQLRSASARGPWRYGSKLSWRPMPIPLAPEDADFEHAAIWKIELPPIPQNPYLSDVLLNISYEGDVARLYLGPELLDDNFWNGQAWTVGMKDTIPDWRSSRSPLELRILPLPKDYPMYLQEPAKLHFTTAGLADSLEGVRLVPRYSLQFEVKPDP